MSKAELSILVKRKRSNRLMPLRLLTMRLSCLWRAVLLMRQQNRICAHCEDEETVQANSKRLENRTDIAAHSEVRDHRAATGDIDTAAVTATIGIFDCQARKNGIWTFP